MRTKGLHPTQYHAVTEGPAHPFKKGDTTKLYQVIRAVHFKRVMVNGPTRHLNSTQRARVLAARKEAGL